MSSLLDNSQEHWRKDFCYAENWALNLIFCFLILFKILKMAIITLNSKHIHINIFSGKEYYYIIYRYLNFIKHWMLIMLSLITAKWLLLFMERHWFVLYNLEKMRKWSKCIEFYVVYSECYIVFNQIMISFNYLFSFSVRVEIQYHIRCFIGPENKWIFSNLFEK